MSAKPIILITCANGCTSKLLVPLLASTGKFTVRAGVRDIEKGKEAFQGLDNVEVVTLDDTDETSKKAFEGVYGVYMIIPFPVHQCFPVWFKHAKEVGVKHLIFQSVYTATKPNAVHVNEVMSDYTDEVQASSVPHTILRPTFFHQNIEKSLMPQILKGVIANAADNATYSVVDVRDMVAVAVKVFLHPEAHFGRTYRLTGGVTTDGEQAKLLSDALGRQIQYVNLPKAEYQAQISKTKLPDEHKALILELDDEKKDPLFPDLANLLGRPAITFEQYIKEIAPTILKLSSL